MLKTKFYYCPAYILLICMLTVATFQSRAAEDSAFFDVTNFGAVGDGQTKDTIALQKAIDACHARGGGTVYLPNGVYLTGTLILKSNVTLHIEAEAVLLGSADLDDYVPHEFYPEWERQILGLTKTAGLGTRHLIYAIKSENISITGRGTIDGQGRIFWDEDFKPLPRPNQMVQFDGCSNVVVEGITLRNSPSWALQFLVCDRVVVQNISILNYRRGPNTDGIDINSSSNVSISNCYINTGDDAICLKARYKQYPCENITVTNCTLISDDSAIKFGTRSSGDIKNCVFTNCVIRNSNYGISFFMKDGGTYSDIRFSNIIIETGGDRPKRNTYPIFMDLEKRTEDSKVGAIHDIVFSNISIITPGHCLIGGMPDKPIENLTFDNVSMRIIPPYEAMAKNKPRGVRGLEPPPPELNYATAPAHFTIANVKGLIIRNFQVRTDGPTPKLERHAIWGVNLRDVTVDGFKGRQAVADGQLATLYFNNTQDLYITGSQAADGAGTFLQLEGESTKNITVIGNDLSRARQAFSINTVAKNTFFQTANRLP